MGSADRAFSLSRPLVVSLLMLLALSSVKYATAGPTKWTILVYMLADNNLEQFGLFDLEEMMAAMADERPGDCTTTACDGTCPPNKVETYTDSRNCHGGSVQRRCCSPSNYPDILIMVDKGQGSPLPYRAYQNFQKMQYADYSLLEGYWTSAKTVKALPGGRWQQFTEVDELDMASTATIKDFLQEGFRRFPPEADRKYMVVYWDHGNGWLGYGADGKCSSTGSYADHDYCSVASLATLEAGIAAGLAGVTNPVTGQPLKLDIIGFDACLMAMYEVGSVMAPYAHYLLASELLEPGQGWDYSSLGNLVEGTRWSGAAVDPAVGHSEADLADLLINSFMDSQFTGLTLALMDLRQMDTNVAGGLDATLNEVSVALEAQMESTPALAIQLLQQRTLLGLIEGGEDSVDLGALLTRLAAITPSGALKDKVNAAIAAYSATIVKFQHDGILPDATGMAIYFPSTKTRLDRKYTPFVGTEPAALTGWLSFLNGLYDAIAVVGASANLQDVNFMETYAVPYWAVDSSTWITHGTLTTLAGLTADLMYGFISPTGTDFITAGTTVGRIAQYAAVGAWSGQLWGLVQDLATGDGAVDGLALAYADEQKITGTDGNVKKLVVQMQVYYAKSCYSPTSEMTTGMLKYTLNMDMDPPDSSLQLYTSGASKVLGEVSPTTGGVIIPYLNAIDLTGLRSGKTASFGYSDCLKWGYHDSIKVAAFSATQAAGILGLDLTRDLATMLTVRGINGRMRALYGAFEPAQRTEGGCQCAQLWSYKDSQDRTVYVKGQCVNPEGAHARPWCQYEPESCTATPTAVDAKPLTDFCALVATLSGCKCHANWRLDGPSYYGTCASTGDPLGSWCVVDKATCPGVFRAHGYGNKTVTATVGGVETALTGQDFDYCQVNTINSCKCSNSWQYGGQTYSGTCRTGLLANTNIPGISDDTNWCFVDKQCAKGKRIDGFVYDLCTPVGGRVTESGTACQFPADYNGVSLYSCISYNHSSPGVETSKPWCFTDAATAAWGYCTPWTCTAALKANCPAVSPDASNPAAGWGSPACLETLCNARKDLANVSMCTQDTAEDRTLLSTAYATLAGSTAYNQLLSGMSDGAGSLDAYCNKHFGYQCMDRILDPECPGLFRQNNVWMASTNKATLCDSRCLKALCQLQEQAKTSVTGTLGVSGEVEPIACADGELTTSIMWSLTRLIDTTCGFPGPISLACNKLLSPPQLCAVDTQLTEAAGNITDGAPLGNSYSASTECSWTVNKPEQPYISLNFTRLSTETLYDMVTVEDFDGLIGRFSGDELPSTLSTDTGLMRVKFSTDASKQEQGFAAQYRASNTPQVHIPTCFGGNKLVQVTLRTRAYGSEISWVVSKRSLLNVVLTPTPTEQNIVMAGGLLPPSVRSRIPSAVAAHAQIDYKDYRSYYSYACLDTGGYNLFSYDSYGDGWEGGRITVAQVVNATTGCTLLTGGSPAQFNLTTQFTVTSDASTSSSACSSLQSPDGPYYYVEAGLVVMSEDTRTFILAKQRKLKEGIASLLDVDSSQVTVQSLTNATSAEITDSLKNITAASRHAAARSGVPSSSNGGGVGDTAAVAALGLGRLATRKLQSPAEEEESLAAAAAGTVAAGGSIQDMLQEQRLLGGVSGRLKAQQLNHIAVSTQELMASGALDATQRQLDQAEHWLQPQQHSASPPAAVLLDSTPASHSVHSPAESEAAAAAAEHPRAEALAALVAHSAAEGAQTKAAEAAAAAGAVVTAAAADLVDSISSDEPAAADAALSADPGVVNLSAIGLGAGEQLVRVVSESRKLQQLLTLTDEGTWQDVAAAAAGEAYVPAPVEADSNTTTSSSSEGSAAGSAITTTSSSSSSDGSTGDGSSTADSSSSSSSSDGGSVAGSNSTDANAGVDESVSGSSNADSAAATSTDGAASAGTNSEANPASTADTGAPAAAAAAAAADSGASVISGSSSATDAGKDGAASVINAAAADASATSLTVTGPEDAIAATDTGSSGSSSTSSGSSTNADSSSSSGAGNSGPSVPAVLAEKPLGSSAGTAPVSGPVLSDLMLQLQEHKPNSPIKQTSTGNVRAGGVPVIVVKVSPSEAFGGPELHAAAASGHAAAVRLKDGTANMAAAPKPGADGGAGAVTQTVFAAEGPEPAVATEVLEPDADSANSVPAAAAAGPGGSRGPAGADSTSDTEVDSADELSFEPDDLPYRPRPFHDPQAGGAVSADGLTLVLSSALEHRRSLAQVPGPGSDVTTAGNSAGSVLTLGSDSSISSKGQNRDGKLPVGLAQIAPEVLGEVIASGRQRPKGKPRPRPPGGMFVATQPSERVASDSTTGTATRAAGGTERGGVNSGKQQQQHQLWSKPEAEAIWGDSHAVALPLSWPEQLLAVEAAQQQQQGARRQLLQTAPDRGVTLVVRVNGYKDLTAVAAAEADLRDVITNGTLATRLADQGWPGVSVGLLYTSTGSVGSFWQENNVIKIIIAACVAGGTVAIGVLGAWYIRRRRQAGAAQVPGASGATPTVGVPAAGRMSYAAGQPVQYMSPQQAAAVVVPYPHSPYGRTASPSAPMLLTPSQQQAIAAAAAGGSGGPYSRMQGGRASMGPAYPSVGGSLSPVGYAAFPGSGGSWSGPVCMPSLQQFQQQQLQQVQYQQQQGQQGHNYQMLVYPAPVPGGQQQGPAGSGRTSPHGPQGSPGGGRASSSSAYGFAAQPPPGYPVIAPPAGGMPPPQQQQQWQHQR